MKLTLGLGNAEESPDTHEHNDTTKDKVRSVPQATDHVRGGTGNDEGTEPGISSGDGNAKHTDVEREDLGGVGPGDTLPGSADDEGVDVHTGHGEVSPSITLGHALSSSTGGISAEDIATEVPHGQAAEDSTPDETLATTDTLDDEEGEGEHSEGLEAAVQTGAEETVAGTCDAESLEDAGRVVGDDVDTSEALQEHEQDTDGHAVPHTGGEELLELVLLAHAHGAAELDLGADLANLVAHVRVVGGQLADHAEDRLGLLEAVLTGEPSRGFRAEKDATGEKDTGSELQGQGNGPLGDGVDGDGLRGGVVDPETQHTTSLGSDLEDTDESTTNRGRSSF